MVAMGVLQATKRCIFLYALSMANDTKNLGGEKEFVESSKTIPSSDSREAFFWV